MRPQRDDLNVSPQAAVKKLDELRAEWHGAGEGRIRIWYGLRTSSSTSDELCRLVKSGADKAGVGIHVHLAVNPAETAEVQKKFGMRPVERFRRLGLMEANLYAVHMGAIDEAEVELVVKTGTKICHCASASMFAAFACIPHGKLIELAAAAATFSFATEPPAISRSLDLVRARNVSAFRHKD